MKLDWNGLSARERDAVVAERVMGWTLDKVYCETGHWRTDSMGLLQATYDDCGSGEFSPSTNIAHAWLVVERMRGKGFGFYVGFSVMHQSHFCSFDGDDAAGMANAPTASEAICLAACRAEGVEV